MVEAFERVSKTPVFKKVNSMDLKNIITTGFMGSGSSAATDLLREFESVDCKNGSFEYVFLHCPDGVFDLEDKLLQNNNAVRSDEALRSFRNTMLDLFSHKYWWFSNYKKKISPDFMKYVDVFLERITTCEYKGYWYEQEKVSTGRLCVNAIRKKLHPNKAHAKKMDNRLCMAFPTKEQFYAAANSFLNAIIHEIADIGQIALLDQLFLPHNLNRIESYIPNSKYILVKRDPRDVFILNKYYWIAQGNPIPFPTDVEKYCEFYHGMMTSMPKIENTRIKCIWFEDLVLSYEQTLKELCTFLNFQKSSHTKKFSFFDPHKSSRNIGLYLDEQRFIKESVIIEKKLGPYLYQKAIDSSLLSRSSEVF